MPEHPQAVLRVAPEQIPLLRVAFHQAASEMTNQLGLISQEGQIPEPWLGDPVSATIKLMYDAHVMSGAPGSTVAHLTAYRDELVRVHETLAEMEAEYRRAEGDNAALWGRA
jgi:hypothetical protein